MKILGLFFAVLLIQVAAGRTNAAEIPAELQGVGVEEHLGSEVSIADLEFLDESGQTVKLDKYFRQGRPVVLSLVYFECPNLCTLVLNGLVDTLKKIDWTPGQQFEVVTVSIDPSDTPELAKEKKENYFKKYDRPAATAGWHFLTAKKGAPVDPVKKLADQVGFKYRYDAKEKQFAHSAVLFVLTPEGKISRYLYGAQYWEKDFRLALLEASQGKIGTIMDRILLFCFRYDPTTKTYSLYLTRVMQAAGGATVLIFGGYLALFWRRQRINSKQSS